MAGDILLPIGNTSGSAVEDHRLFDQCNGRAFLLLYFQLSRRLRTWQACLLRGAGSNRSRAQGRLSNSNSDDALGADDDEDDEDDRDEEVSIGTPR